MDGLLSLLEQQTNVRVIDAMRFVPIDLSAANTALQNIDTADAAEFESYIERHLADHQAEAAFGGYNETRSLYQRSALFTDEKERNIHLAVDVWVKAGTTVFAALDATVHSFNYNAGPGDYGPTIILEHRLGEYTFYTLYGHLSVDSITELEIGDRFKKGQPLATLGDAHVNGGYAPHLHFQLIRDIGDSFGDYPGVCNIEDLDFYLHNCPDPNILLKLK